MIHLGLLGQAPVKSEFWKTFVLEYINTMAVDRTAALVFIMRYFRP